MKPFIPLRELWDDFIHILFPRPCVACHTILLYQEQHICTKCRFSLPKRNDHLSERTDLLQKFAYEPKVKQVMAFLYFVKGGVAQRIIRALKYHNVPEIGVLVGDWYGRDLAVLQLPVSAIIPVPLHVSKLRSRGFNQSEEFARGLSNRLKIPVYTHLVKRIKATSTQTRKTKVQRWKNMDAVYEVTDPAALAGHSVLLVDDVLTTGATLGELVTELVKYDVHAIYIATIAAGR